MYDLNIKLSPKEILAKDFKFDAKGYRPKEVDEYLDTIIEDYDEFIRFTKKLIKDNNDLKEDNARLEGEIRKLKMIIETQEESSAGANKFASNNVDLLRRLSNLEKVVYGKEE